MPLVRRVLTDLRRLPHASDLGSEAFIRARPRSNNTVIHRAARRSPPRVRLLQARTSLS